MVALTTALTGLTTTGTNVTRGRVFTVSASELPHLSIMQGDEEPVVEDNSEEAVNIHAYYRLNAHIEVAAQAASGVLETTLNLISKEISDAMNIDSTLGVSGVLDSYETSHDRPEYSEDKDQRTALMEITYTIIYRRLRSDATLN